MRKILQHIAGMDLSVPSQGLGGWTDFRMVERGFGYVKKVKEWLEETVCSTYWEAL